MPAPKLQSRASTQASSNRKPSTHQPLAQTADVDAPVEKTNSGGNRRLSANAHKRRSVSALKNEPLGGETTEKRRSWTQGTAQTGAPGGQGMFADNLKDEAHKNIAEKDYDVAMYYYETGCAQAIAKSNIFGNATLLVITMNALWIGIEVEFNDAPKLTLAPWYFQAGEYFFAVFFTFEWCTRFLAFKRKRDGLRDKWFCFDTFLVALMVFETFVMPYITPDPPSEESEEGDGSVGRLLRVSSGEPAPKAEGAAPSGMGNLSMLRMLRLLRLTRMVRLMRSVPELVTLLRSVKIAFRSTAAALSLLLIIIYVFAIIFKSQLRPDGNLFLVDSFGRLPAAMWTLLLTGTFLDNISRVCNELRTVSGSLTVLFCMFVGLAAFTVLNMLVGLLCEVVDAVAAAEKEKMMVAWVKHKLMGVLETLDTDGNGTISQDEFNELLNIPEAREALDDLGVDVPNLLSLSDHLFEKEDVDITNKDDPRRSQKSVRKSSGDSADSSADSSGRTDSSRQDEDEEPVDEDEVCLSFADFLEMVIRLRKDNQPSVLDIVDLRKLILKSQRNFARKLDAVEDLNTKLTTDMHSVYKTIGSLSSKEGMTRMVEWCAEGLRAQAEEQAQANNQRLRTQVAPLAAYMSGEMFENRADETDAYQPSDHDSPPLRRLGSGPPVVR